MNMQYVLDIIYLFASVTFVIGLKMLSHPATARRGNLIACAGMSAAIIGTILIHDNKVQPIIYTLILSAIGLGTIAGWLTAKKVQMTKMPELVSIFNGMGGACAALISLIEFQHMSHEVALSLPEDGGNMMMQLIETFKNLAQQGGMGHTAKLAMIMAGLVIGSVSFAGSIIAWAKLNGTLNKPIRLPQYNIINNALMLGLFVYAFLIVNGNVEGIMHVYMLFVAALLYGVMFVLPIGGADMPVVISLLNSFTGLAAACGGFMYNNKAMLTGGILVGSAGTLLTLVMCKAMNRPLSNVIFGAFGAGTKAAGEGRELSGSIKEISITDAAVLMNYSKKVIIVPGYGLAVAQAQHVIHELETILEERGVEVKYAIHPVAGRMPGHMNVLLAESNVSYDKLVEMEEINPEFANTDVVLVVGANDVVNPAAHNDSASPIFGMPILDVENAKNIIVNKRSMNAGYAGIENELFYNPKNSMLFGDAKSALTKLVSELKAMD
ncbi:MAG: NAD(P)(+) transhydrogenase (Re/Si-specific) subunit beta [Bacteroidota bacterium]|nr:NAD(P)(+) transhydrogenase (Re/Si-specific) subunit beta [Bacteroidota bacterium]